MPTETPLKRESDCALLQRFARVRDESAFAELVRRHGPLVLGVCQRRLRQRQDAEDAFQAVFVTLSAKAASLRRVRSLSGWLHNVALRISCNLTRGNQRRLRREQAGASPREIAEERSVAELREVIDEALARLPARYREVVLLCDLQGATRAEAAAKLKRPVATVGAWLTRGRIALRDDLVRRGVTVGVTAGVAAAASVGSRLSNAAPTVPPELALATIRQAQHFLAGHTPPDPTSIAIQSLSQGVLHTMFLSKISTTVGVFAISAALVLGAGPLGHTLGLTGAAKAGQIFYDDFNDRSATDGNPETWRGLAPWTNGQFTAASGDFELRARLNNPLDATLVSYVPQHVLSDTSIRSQVRAAGTNNDFGIALVARANPSTYNSYFAEVDASGDLFIVRGGGGAPVGAVLGTVPSNFRPLTEDVVLQFDLVGSKLSLSAWRPGETMPTVPQLTVFDEMYTEGVVGVILDFPPSNGVATFRYVWVADEPIQNIPEPSTIALGSLSAIALAACAFRVRLGRVRALAKPSLTVQDRVFGG